MSDRRAVPPKPGATAPDPHKADLDRSVVSGLAWTGGMRGITQTLQWLAALLVVRLLTPGDYGLVAMAMAYLGLVRMFSEFGLDAAIIQRRNLTSDQIARMGGVSVLTGTLLALLSILLSGLVARFFHEPRVASIIIVLSATFLFAGIDVVPRSLLKRDLKFKRLAMVQASQNLTYAGASLTLAAFGFGYWSLVLGALIGAFVRMVVAVASRRHPVAWPRDIDSIKAELWFGWHVVVSQFALYVRKFSDILVVGRLLGRDALGAYNVGWTQANLAVDRVTPLVSEVSPSVLAATQHDLPAMRRYIRVFTEGLAFLSFPATFGMAAVADHFVLVVLGNQWYETIDPLRILVFVAALRSITPILSQVLIAKDLARKNMQFAIAAALSLPVFFLIGSRWGITGVALGWLVGQPFITLTMLLPQALRAAEMSFREYVVALRPATIASFTMVVAVVGARLVMPTDWPLSVRFVVEVTLGVAVYGGAVFTSYRKRLRSLLSTIRAARSKGGRVVVGAT